MSKLHSVDLEPGSDRASHHLLVDGVIVARFNSLATALEVRAQMVSEACLQGAEEVIHE